MEAIDVAMGELNKAQAGASLHVSETCVVLMVALHCGDKEFVLRQLRELRDYAIGVSE